MKYLSKKTVIDGITFASKKEAKRFVELRRLQEQGKISNLELQPVYELQEGFKKGDKTYRPITYIADFKYIEDGKIIVEDVKGFMTPEYKIKKKLLLYKYDDFEFREIK